MLVIFETRKIEIIIIVVQFKSWFASKSSFPLLPNYKSKTIRVITFQRHSLPNIHSPSPLLCYILVVFLFSSFERYVSQIKNFKWNLNSKMMYAQSDYYQAGKYVETENRFFLVCNIEHTLLSMYLNIF